MAVKTKTLSWTRSTSPDVKGYNLYVEESPNAVNLNSTKHDLGDVDSVELNGLLGDVDGVYNIGLTSYDDAGNEGPMAILTDIPLDFVAPAPPTGLTIS